MKFPVRRLSLLVLLPLLFGCAAKAPPKSQLQIRQFQTRDYATKDIKKAMKAMLNVLQDEGFILKEANTELGFLTATKDADIESKSKAFWATVWAGNDAKWDKNATIEVTANLTETKNGVKIRANFQRKVLDNKGNVADIVVIDDEKFYQDFFSKVSKGLFLEKEKL